MTSPSADIRVVTIWATYGDYHVARIKALAKHGFDVVPFAHCDYESTYPFFQAKPPSLIVVNPGLCDRINPLLSWWRTWRLLRIHRPDLVLTSGYERLESLAALMYAHTTRRRGGLRPATILMLNNRAQDHPRKKVRELVKSVYLRAFDGFLASGADTHDYLQRLGVASSRIELGCNCVDNQQIAKLVAQHRATTDRASRRIGYLLVVARLVPKKNVSGVIRAYHSYLQRVPDAVAPLPLVICGDGPERKSIEDLIQRLGLVGSVSLVGEASGIEAVVKQLADCKALVLASVADETWGLVVNEAMAAGCPVLVSRQCGCARDLVEEGLNGFTFDGNDSEELARHMLWVHANQGLLRAMGEKSVEIVDRFTPARFALSASKLAKSAREPATQSAPGG